MVQMGWLPWIAGRSGRLRGIRGDRSWVQEEGARGQL